MKRPSLPRWILVVLLAGSTVSCTASPGTIQAGVARPSDIGTATGAAPTAAPPTTAPAVTSARPAPVPTSPRATGSPAGTTAAAPVPAGLRQWLGPQVRQAILVTTPTMTSTYAELSLWQRGDGGWRRIRPPVPARIGTGGFTWHAAETDTRTPIGAFALPLAFGWPQPPQTRLPWRTATSGSVWVDDPTSPLYDTWQEGPAAGRWRSAEPLRITPYQLAIDFAVNPEHRPGGGSAFFLHLPIGAATQGCVTVDATTLRWILGWLDPTQQPRLVAGPVPVAG